MSARHERVFPLKKLYPCFRPPEAVFLREGGSKKKRPPLQTVFHAFFSWKNSDYFFSSAFSSTTGFDFLNLRKRARPPRSTRKSGMAIRINEGRTKITKRIRNSTKFWKKKT